MTFRDAGAFVTNDAGRSKSKRPKQQNDCTVRAFALVMGIPYDTSYDLLRAAGRKASRAFDIEKYCRSHTYDQPTEGRRWYFHLEKMGLYKGQRYGRATTKGATRYRLMDFLKDNPTGQFMVGTAGHIFAVLDGVVHDDLPWHYEENRPVYCWVQARLASKPLWQASTVGKPIRPRQPDGSGGRPYTRKVCIVEGNDYREAMGAAMKVAEWAVGKGRDLQVVPL